MVQWTSIWRRRFLFQQKNVYCWSSTPAPGKNQARLVTLILSHESPKKLPRPHFALSSQIPAFKWGKCRISKDLSGTLYATTPPHLLVGNRQLFLSTEPCVAWNAYPEFTRWFPSCYHGYSSNSQNDQSADAQLDWLDVSPAYVVGGSSWRVIDNEDSEDTTTNLDNTQQTSNNDSIGSNSTYTTPAPYQDVTGSLGNDDGNGNGNGKKATGLVSVHTCWGFSDKKAGFRKRYLEWRFF